MAQLTIFTGSDLPIAYEHQIRSFVRLHWHDEYAYDLDAPLVPPERKPRHVVMAERHALFSHARISEAVAESEATRLRFCCLGDVFTYPAFRRRGYGGAVTAAATGLIRQQGGIDFAVLFCDPSLEAFYGRHGWAPAPRLRVTRGNPGAPEPQEGLPMLLLLSEAGRRLAAAAELSLPGYGW